jgi:hypothetical protein
MSRVRNAAEGAVSYITMQLCGLLRTTGSAATGTANRPATTATTSTTKSKWYPDHAVLSGATKDSLKNMAEFKYD